MIITNSVSQSKSVQSIVQSSPVHSPGLAHPPLQGCKKGGGGGGGGGANYVKLLSQRVGVWEDTESYSTKNDSLQFL